VSACLSKQHTKFLQGKEVKFFSKDDENKATVALLCASLSLSLSLSLLSFLYALFSPTTRRRIIARDSSSSSSSSSTSSSKARPFPTLLGKFYY
jgi:uncharacterized protein YhaN